ncbi:MAG TPA: outer membrane beta-barrel protein [Acidobacteriota bacterium]|nr:outer membrane beta-barrel protein [Acidobacteriota bacterium]
MKRTFALAAALLVLGAGVRLGAQSYRSFQDEYDAIREGVRLRLGPFRLVPRFRLADVGYDSNVYFRERVGEIVRDATATLSPELRGYWLLGHAAILSFTENPEYLFYAREKGLRTFTNSFSGGLRLRLLRRFSLSGDYHSEGHVRRVLSDLDHRIRDSSRGGTAALFFETARGTAIGATASLEDFRYQDLGPETTEDIYGRALDRRETSAGLETYYRVFSRSYFFAVAGWRRYEFVHPESTWRNAEAVEASGGFRFPLTGRARGVLRFGWKSFRPDAADRKPFSGLTAATEVVFRLGRIGLTLGLHRDHSFSYIEDAYYYVDTRGRANLSLYVAPFLRLDAGVQLGGLDYPEPQTVWSGGEPVIVERRRDDERILTAGPVVRLGGTVGLGVTYNLYARSSNAPGFAIRRDFIGAFLTYEF